MVCKLSFVIQLRIFELARSTSSVHFSEKNTKNIDCTLYITTYKVNIHNLNTMHEHVEFYCYWEDTVHSSLDLLNAITFEHIKCMFICVIPKLLQRKIRFPETNKQFLSRILELQCIY